MKKLSVMVSLAVLVLLAFFTLVVGACATTGHNRIKTKCLGETVYDDDLGLCVCTEGKSAYIDGATVRCLTDAELEAEVRARLEGVSLSGKPQSAESTCPGKTVWNNSHKMCTCPKDGEYPTKNGERCIAAIRRSLDTYSRCQDSMVLDKSLGRCICPESNVEFLSADGEEKIICLAREELPVRLLDGDRLCCTTPGLVKKMWRGSGGGYCVPCTNSMERDECETQGGVWRQDELTCDCPGLGAWDVFTTKCVSIPPTSMVGPAPSAVTRVEFNATAREVRAEHEAVAGEVRAEYEATAREVQAEREAVAGEARAEYEAVAREARTEYEALLGAAQTDQEVAEQAEVPIGNEVELRGLRERTKALLAEERELKKATKAAEAEVRALNRAITAAEVQERRARMAAEAQARAEKMAAEVQGRAAKRTAEAKARATKRAAEAAERELNRALEASARALEARDRAFEALCKAKKGTWNKPLLRCE